LQFGRYAALLAYTKHPEGKHFYEIHIINIKSSSIESSGIAPEGLTDVSLTRQVCQHIIGMAPLSVENEEDQENSLLHQSFLLDEDLKVGPLLQSSGIEVLDFIRAEVGRAESE